VAGANLGGIFNKLSLIRFCFSLMCESGRDGSGTAAVCIVGLACVQWAFLRPLDTAAKPSYADWGV